jgi:hypothetical protein
VVEVIEQMPPPSSASKTSAFESAAATEVAPTEARTVDVGTAEAGATEDTNLETTLSDIDNMLLNMAAGEAAKATEKTPAIVPGKGKEKAKDTSKEEDFNF